MFCTKRFINKGDLTCTYMQKIQKTQKQKIQKQAPIQSTGSQPFKMLKSACAELPREEYLKTKQKPPPLSHQTW